MREIKFRAWHKDIESMYDNDFVIITLRTLLEDSRFRVMQYTGLKDKNGKEIYEGDIVTVNSSISDVKRATVKFDEGRFYLATSEDTEYNLELYQEDGYYPSMNWSECEVIGNIYENPELLK